MKIPGLLSAAFLAFALNCSALTTEADTCTCDQIFAASLDYRMLFRKEPHQNEPQQTHRPSVVTPTESIQPIDFPFSPAPKPAIWQTLGNVLLEATREYLTTH